MSFACLATLNPVLEVVRLCWHAWAGAEDVRVEGRWGRGILGVKEGTLGRGMCMGGV